MTHLLNRDSRSAECPTHGVFLYRYSPPQCPACHQQMLDRLEREKLDRQICAIITTACVPPEYGFLPDDELKDKVREWLGLMPGHQQLFLLGGLGSGKSTQLGSAILSLARRGITARYFDCQEIVERLKAASGKGDSAYERAIQELVSPQVLALDDLRPTAEWEAAHIRAVVEKRTAFRRATAMTSNMSFTQLKSHNLETAQIASRMQRDAYIVQISDPSYRRPAYIGPA